MAREQLSWMRVAPKLTKCIFLVAVGSVTERCRQHAQQLLNMYVPMLHDTGVRACMRVCVRSSLACA